MKRKLLIAAGIATGALVLLLAVIAMQPADFSIQRSTTVAAPPETVFGLVNDFHQWDKWSPWAKLDPAMVTTFEGEALGAGAIYTWKGNSAVGEGKMTILESRSPELVGIQLEFIAPMKATNTAEFSFKPEGAGTAVTWSMAGRNNFMGKAFGFFVDMDAMLGADFEKGLAAMKAAAESAAQPEGTSSMSNATEAKTEDMLIERLFDAPRDQVWRCWTEPEQLMKWWGPKDFGSPAATIDFRVGGKYHFCMRMPDGKDLWSTGNYQEIVPMERIVFTDSFADPEGNVVSSAYYNMGDTWPEVLKVTLTFEQQGDKTRFTLFHEDIPVSDLALCMKGWNESFDKMEAVLAQPR